MPRPDNGNEPPLGTPYDPLAPQPIPGANNDDDFRFPPQVDARGQDDGEPPRADLLPPEDAEGERDRIPPVVKEEVENNKPDPKPMPSVTDSTDPMVPFFPSDIPAFARVKAGVYSGEKPFPEGLNWLKDKGFVTVVHLHDPTESTAAAQRNFEAKELRYFSLAINPGTLNQSIVDRFNALVGDQGNRPVFVYDRDGSLAGPMWFLHFRLIDELGTDEAITQASAYGFKEKGDDFDQQMVRAAQRVLEEAKK